RLPADARPAGADDPCRRVAPVRREGHRGDLARVQEGRTCGDQLSVRIGVVGGGLVAQAMHIPNLAARPDLFRLAALAEPSETGRAALGRRSGSAGLHAASRGLLEAGGLDAVLIASPAGTHAEVVLSTLAAGLHVFVEKPMCITLADADAIAAARDRAG